VWPVLKCAPRRTRIGTVSPRTGGQAGVHLPSFQPTNPPASPGSSANFVDQKTSSPVVDHINSMPLYVLFFFFIPIKKMMAVETLDQPSVCAGEGKKMPSSRGGDVEYLVERIVSRRKQVGCEASPSRDVSTAFEFSRPLTLTHNLFRCG
jgi:hypothetical protein